jgi:hypothetical protein
MTIENRNHRIPPGFLPGRRTFLAVGVTGLVGSTVIAKLLAAPPGSP